MCVLQSASYRKLVPKGSLLQTTGSSCFEIWGYDVMADADLNAWLLEVISELHRCESAAGVAYIRRQIC